jgi:hypothetical protein
MKFLKHFDHIGAERHKQFFPIDKDDPFIIDLGRETTGIAY